MIDRVSGGVDCKLIHCFLSRGRALRCLPRSDDPRWSLAKLVESTPSSVLLAVASVPESFVFTCVFGIRA